MHKPIFNYQKLRFTSLAAFSIAFLDARCIAFSARFAFDSFFIFFSP